MVAEYLNITLDNVRRRLQNKYSKTKKFIENVDFIKIKAGKTTGIIYMLNYQCFEKIIMSGETQSSETTYKKIYDFFYILLSQKIKFTNFIFWRNS
jgi:hypothetical protein